MIRRGEQLESEVNMNSRDGCLEIEILEFPDRHDIILVWVSGTSGEWIESDCYVTPEP